MFSPHLSFIEASDKTEQLLHQLCVAVQGRDLGGILDCFHSSASLVSPHFSGAKQDNRGRMAHYTQFYSENPAGDMSCSVEKKHISDIATGFMTFCTGEFKYTFENGTVAQEAFSMVLSATEEGALKIWSHHLSPILPKKKGKVRASAPAKCKR